MYNKNHLKYLGIYIVISLINGCATGSRAPSSIEELSLSLLIEQIKLTSEIHDPDQVNCKNTYDSLNSRLLNLMGEATYEDSIDLPKLDQEIRASFQARIALKDKIKDFEGFNDCLKSVATTFTSLRYVEDYLIEMRMNLTPTAPVEYVSLKGEFPYLLINPRYKSEFKSYEDLKSGDVLLSRVNNYLSTALTKSGDKNYQFSNVSFVHKDPLSLEILTTENHLEIGNVVEPLIGNIERLNSRVAVFRYQDSKAAHLNKIDTQHLIDIELDPRFELVAEWRNPKKTEESRMKDFILTKIFDRMETESYKINPQLKNDVESKTIWALRRLPVVKAQLLKGLHLNVTAKQIENFIALESIGEALYKALEKASLEYERAMTPIEIYKVLDDLFKQDYENFIRYKQGLEVKKPLFHLLFHP